MDSKQRKARLYELLARLRGGQDVAQRDLKNVLLQDEYSAMQESWTDQQDMRRYVKQKPPAVAEYEARMKKALFEYAKAESLNSSSERLRRNNDGLRADQRAYRRAETQFERLIEFLDEQCTADPSLQAWFDRPLVFGMESDIGPSPSAMPRVVSSRSLDRQGDSGIAGIRPKRAVKLEALDLALQALEAREASEARIARQIAEEEAKERAARLAYVRSLRTR